MSSGWIEPWYDYGMKTIGWRISNVGEGDETFYLALHGDTALLARTDFQDEVWQFRSPEGQSAAIDRLVLETSEIEKRGGVLLGEPVEFDLSPEAIDKIRLGEKLLDWVTAPTLFDELSGETYSMPRPLSFVATPPSDWEPISFVTTP